MNEIIIIVIIFTILIGIVFFLWSIKYTREKYYNDFLQQRKNRKNIREQKND